jgi:hypothetical protein
MASTRVSAEYGSNVTSGHVMQEILGCAGRQGDLQKKGRFYAKQTSQIISTLHDGFPPSNKESLISTYVVMILNRLPMYSCKLYIIQKSMGRIVSISAKGYRF